MTWRRKTGRQAFPQASSCPGYRLPIEAEWEYFARAGVTGATYAGELEGEVLSSGVTGSVIPVDAGYHIMAV